MGETANKDFMQQEGLESMDCCSPLTMILAEDFLEMSGKMKLISNSYKTSLNSNCYKT